MTDERPHKLEVTAASLRVVDEGAWGLSVERYIPHTYPAVAEEVTNTVLIFPSEIDGLIEALQTMRDRKAEQK